MKIAIVGLGLIGASLAKAIKAHTNHHILGIDLNADVLSAAAKDGVIDQAGTPEDLGDTDLTILAIYPEATIRFVKTHAAVFAPDSIIMDTCGVKRQICKHLAPVAARYGFYFLGGHPMAGKEQNGYAASCADLFDGASMILTPTKQDSFVLKTVSDLAISIGFGKVTVSTPEEHDRIIAYTSQLPHVLACAYVLDPDARLHAGFSAGSYKDVSRVATINAPMWRELFLENRDCLSGHIQTLIQNLTKLNDCIKQSDGARLEQMLSDSDRIKRQIG